MKVKLCTFLFLLLSSVFVFSGVAFADSDNDMPNSCDGLINTSGNCAGPSWGGRVTSQTGVPLANAQINIYNPRGDGGCASITISTNGNGDYYTPPVNGIDASCGGPGVGVSADYVTAQGIQRCGERLIHYSSMDTHIVNNFTCTIVPSKPAPTADAQCDDESLSEIVINWQRTANTNYYELYRTENNQPAQKIGDGLTGVGSLPALTFFDRNVTPGASYRYQVRSVNANSSTGSDWTEADVALSCSTFNNFRLFGVLYSDDNQNGKQDTGQIENGVRMPVEPTFPNELVQLLNANGTVIDSVRTADGSGIYDPGTYTFLITNAGSYTVVHASMPDGYTRVGSDRYNFTVVQGSGGLTRGEGFGNLPKQ